MSIYNYLRLEDCLVWWHQTLVLEINRDKLKVFLYWEQKLSSFIITCNSGWFRLTKMFGATTPIPGLGWWWFITLWCFEEIIMVIILPHGFILSCCINYLTSSRPLDQMCLISHIWMGMMVLFTLKFRVTFATQTSPDIHHPMSEIRIQCEVKKRVH